jgi:hypothetical protein
MAVRLRSLVAGLGAVVLTTAGCLGGGDERAASSVPLRTGTYSLSARQARGVATVVNFLDAYNSQRHREALALLSRNVGVSDCDYRQERSVEFTGKAEVAAWLRSRFADRDRFVVRRIVNENPEQPTGVLAVEYARRTSKSLVALGFRRGIEPQLATKVGFTSGEPPRISTFANGAVGGKWESCLSP